VALLLVGCGGTATPSPSASQASSGSGTEITAKLTEFKIDLGGTTAPAGPVTFVLTNSGTTVHEFVVFKTDLAADKLPLAEGDTEVDEEGGGLTVVDEVEDIAVGAATSLSVDLPAGHYVLICNLPAHYPSGMRVDFTTS
jgi:uncharacterized cupredoxin-like copper-binding protein